MTITSNLKFKFLLFQIKWHLVLVLSAIILCFCIGKTYELLLFFVSYAGLRYTYCKTYHHPEFKKCVVISIIMLVVSSYITISVKHSLIFSVVVAVLITYILYLIKDYLDLKTKFISNLNNLSNLEELIKTANLSKDDRELCIDMFVNKTPIKQLAAKLNMEPQSVANKKTLLKKKLLK